MWSRAVTGMSLLLLVWAGSVVASEPRPAHQSAKERGIVLYNQFKAISATPFLEIAAEAGDAEAQYYLGEALRKNNRFMTREAQKWLEAAADQGDIYAMIRLGRSGNDLCSVMGNCPQGSKTPNEWLTQAHRVARSLAEQGDPEAMFLMYEITLDADWITKSAEAGDPLAQYWKAITIKQGDGFYLFSSRTEDVEKWFKASAEGGYPKSMQYYHGILAEKNDWEGVRYWHHKAAETGYTSGIYNLGSYLAHEPEGFGHELDLVKAYGLISLLSELDGGGDMLGAADETLPVIAAKMTSEQIEEALEFAEEWKATHPPVSYYPDKLSIY